MSCAFLGETRCRPRCRGEGYRPPSTTRCPATSRRRIGNTPATPCPWPSGQLEKSSLCRCSHTSTLSRSATCARVSTSWWGKGPVSAESLAEPGITADEGVVVGYPADRVSALRGQGARLRSGTVIYAGAVIGERFQTGHHVVVREETRIGDDVSIWSNTMVDYGCEIG